MSAPAVTRGGDGFVRYRTRGNGERLVQRAIRSVGHCEFSLAEQIEAFEALVRWEQDGIKPEGDEVLDMATLKNADYGCKFTRNIYSMEEMANGALSTARAMIPPCSQL